jgi:hypothetical protein
LFAISIQKHELLRIPRGPEDLSHREHPVACRVFQKPSTGTYGEGMFYEVGVRFRVDACLAGAVS